LWCLVRSGLFFLLPDSVIKTLQNIKRASIFPQRKYRSYSWLAQPLKVQLDQRRQRFHHNQNLQTQRPGARSFLIKLESPMFTTFRELEERISASREMERRLPFWDSNMIQFAFSLPTQHSLRGNMGKALHRSAMKGFLPELVLERTTKAEFSIAYKTNMAEIKKKLKNDEFSRRATWVNLREAEQLWQDFHDGKRNAMPEWRLWALFGCHNLGDLE
jgi:asparagine synthase (glutamine-hydrolysing)